MEISARSPSAADGRHRGSSRHAGFTVTTSTTVIIIGNLIFMPLLEIGGRGEAMAIICHELTLGCRKNAADHHVTSYVTAKSASARRAIYNPP